MNNKKNLKKPRFITDEYSATQVHTLDGSYSIIQPKNTPHSETIYIIGHAGPIEHFPHNFTILNAENSIQNLSTHFTTPRSFIHHARENETFKFNVGAFILGEIPAPRYEDYISAGTRFKDYGITSPYFRQFDNIKYNASKSFNFVQKEILSNANFHVAMVTTDEPIRLSTILKSLNRSYSDIRLLLCRT